jgi:hypothetical protein
MSLSQTWCIYVESGASKNFAIARSEKLWGVDQARRFQHKDNSTGVVREIEVGDSIIFVHGISANSRPPPKGWPRIGAEEFERSVGRAKVVVNAKATTGVFEDRTRAVWAGPKAYPYRFGFREVQELSDVDVRDIFRGKGLDALRLAAITLAATPCTPIASVREAPEPVVLPDHSPQGADSNHVKAQWQLARIGVSLGLKVWIPRNDRLRSYTGERLGSMSLQDLPALGLTIQAKTVVENIDVLWIDDDVVVCAFEVEHTTSVYSGILRLSDLVTVQPYTTIRLFIVASQDRRDKVARELARPTFAMSRRPLREHCGFISYDKLDSAMKLGAQLGRHLKFTWISEMAEAMSDQT